MNGKVVTLARVRMRAKKNSFQEKMKASRPTARIGGARKRHGDLPERPPTRGAVHQGRFLHLAWDVLEEALQNPGDEGKIEHRILQDQSGVAVEQSERRPEEYIGMATATGGMNRMLSTVKDRFSPPVLKRPRA